MAGTKGATPSKRAKTTPAKKPAEDEEGLSSHSEEEKQPTPAKKATPKAAPRSNKPTPKSKAKRGKKKDSEEESDDDVSDQDLSDDDEPIKPKGKKRAREED